MESSYSYIDQLSEPSSYDCSTPINTLNRSMDDIIKESVSEPTETRKLIHDLTNLKNDLYSNLQGNLILEDKYDTDEFQKIKENIGSSIGIVVDIMTKFRKQQSEVQRLEKLYHKELMDTESSISKITDFIDFLHVLDVKHKDIDSKEIVKMIKRLGDAIKRSSSVEKIQAEYERELYVFKYYLHHWIKPLNGGNIGNTCSMCLQKPVDTFLNPCGHTGCSDCVAKIGGGGICFICRSHVMRSHKIYFS